MHSVKIQSAGSKISLMNFLYTWYPNTETPTQSATESPTESATESPTESATEPPTQSPAPIIGDIVFDDNNYTESVDNRNRIEKEIPKDNDTNIAVVVKKSEFIGIENNNGGAIHLINCGLKTDGTLFKGCKSNEGAGGAIFIENSREALKDVNLKNLLIIQCSAEYGGGAYIYSDSVQNRVEVTGCIFHKNVATKSESSDKLFGGSAMFLFVKRSRFRKCTFENNNVKIFNDFKQVSLSNVLPLEETSLLLTECKFTIDQNMKYSLFYYGGNHASNIQLQSCIFNGKLNNAAYFIDGQSASKNIPKMTVSSCKFLSNSSNALNQKSQVASIILKDQIFELEKSSEIRKIMKSVILVSVYVMAVVIALVFTLVIDVKKLINPNVYSDDGNEMYSQSNDISTNSLVTPLI